MFEVGQMVKAILTKPLNGNDIAPDLVLNQDYEIKEIILDQEKNQHLDVGLKSSCNYIRSIETSEDLPRGTSIHWCHPSRFELIK